MQPLGLCWDSLASRRCKGRASFQVWVTQSRNKGPLEMLIGDWMLSSQIDDSRPLSWMVLSKSCGRSCNCRRRAAPERKCRSRPGDQPQNLAIRKSVVCCIVKFANLSDGDRPLLWRGPTHVSYKWFRITFSRTVCYCIFLRRKVSGIVWSIFCRRWMNKALPLS